MNFLDLVASRYSVRAYKPDAVPEDALTRILEAARLAPSACNIQPCHLYVVTDPAVRQALYPSRMTWAAAAPVSIVVCTHPAAAWTRAYDRKNHADIDAAIITDHLVLAATAEGLGTCWICAFDPEQARAALRLPEGLEPVIIIPLGYPDKEPPAKQRKALAEIATRV